MFKPEKFDVETIEPSGIAESNAHLWSCPCSSVVVVFHVQYILEWQH